MKNIFNGLILLMVFSLSACELTDLEVEDSPNALRPENADPDFLLNGIQVEVGSWFESMHENGMEMTRMTSMFGPLYVNAYSPQAYDAEWENAYEELLYEITLLDELTTQNEQYYHRGMGKVIQSYAMMVMVDYFGDIPYNEAFQGADNFNPAVTDDEAIYDSALVLLDEAIADFEQDVPPILYPLQDIFYDAASGNVESWIRLANTLKMRIYLNTRNSNGSESSAAFAALLNEGRFITSNSDDWQFQWGSNVANPDARHPQYEENYFTKPVGMDYLGNYFMDQVINGRGAQDPRTRYYFYRQVGSTPTDEQTLPCVTQLRPVHYAPEDVFCFVNENGYWGRDHGNDDGIPPDQQARTVMGLYPIGGVFDDNSTEEVDGDVNGNSGALGAGISPIFLASWVDFMRAEAALTMGTGEDARALLESGIRKSIMKVMNFNNEIGYELPASADPLIPTQAAIDAYVDAVLNDYDNAGDELEVVIMEWYKASFLNGNEPYNMYRRTGFPAGMQFLLAEPSTDFIRTTLYPAVFVNRNSNETVEQKPVDPNQRDNVFWDVVDNTLR